MFHSAKSVDAAFQGVSQKIGTEIWRIQNLEPVPLPKSDYGKFYSGDSYIVLHISLGKGTVNSYDIHYWIGIDTTQEEAEISALKTIELDISLGSRSVQHREPQGFESDKFLSYFRPCIIPLEGGVASGFKKIEEGKFETKLYNCKGNRIARLKQVPFVRSSLNHDDVFILDTVDKIYQFNGANSNIQERAKALEVVQHLKNEYHGGKCTISIVDDGKHAAESDSGDFWVCFGGFAPIGRKASSEDDLAKEIIPGRLYSIADGLLNMEDGTLSKSKLEKKKCYLLDCGAEVFVWVGRATQVDARKSTCKAVQDFINSQSRPISMRITQVIQGYETQSFKSNFESWPLHTETSTEEGRGKVSAFLKKHGVDVKGAAKGSSINDDTSALFQGGGKIEVWYINDDAKIVVSKEDIGKFFSGDCYIVLYTHTSGDKKDEYFLSVWMGKDSTEEDRIMASRLSNKMYNFFKGKAVQGWIFQGKEPPQFIGIFQPMVLLMGGMSSGYKKFIAEKKLNDDTYVKENIAMFQVFNSSMHKNKVDQVIAAATSLCSSDCFVLQSGSTCFIWHGNSSTFEQQEWALKVAEFLKPGSTLKILKEGAETSAFWFILGGKQSYSNKRVAQENVKDPHLYTFLLNNGKLEVSEVFNFSQDDLLPEDILILDTHVEVFLWVGHLVPPKEKENAFDIGQKYIKHVMALDGLSSDVPLYKITEGNEPFFFTGYFSWDSAKAAIPGNSFTKKFSLLFGSTLSGSELSVKSNQSHRSGQTQWASAMDALSSALNSTTQFESSEKSQELNQSGPTQRAAALEALTSAFNPTSIQPESRKSHERSHSGSSQRAAALEALTSAFNPISAQPELSEKSQEPNHSGPTQRAAALEALTSAFNPTSTHSEVLSLYKHLQTLQDSGSTQRAAALEALTSAFNPTKAQSESSEKSQKPIHSSSSQKAAALEALTAAFNPTPAQSESSERSHEIDHSKPTQRASAMELLSSAFNPTSTKSEPPERSYEPNHSGPTQRASAWESLSSAFNSVSTKPSLPKPRLSSQGSQMAAAIAALSSVLTSETPARLSRSSSPVPDVVEHNAVPVECNADVVQHNVLTTDVDHSRHEAMDVDHCRPGTESNANAVEVSKIEDNRISEQMSENSHNNPELDNERFEEEDKEGASTFSYERLKATSNNPVVGIDYKRREAYLSSMEFESVFKMTKEEFYKQPKWKQDGQKRKLELF